MDHARYLRFHSVESVEAVGASGWLELFNYTPGIDYRWYPGGRFFPRARARAGARVAGQVRDEHATQTNKKRRLFEFFPVTPFSPSPLYSLPPPPPGGSHHGVFTVTRGFPLERANRPRKDGLDEIEATRARAD